MRFFSLVNLLHRYKRESINGADPFHPLFRSIYSHLVSTSDKKCYVFLNLIVSCQINKHVENKNTAVELKKRYDENVNMEIIKSEK